MGASHAAHAPTRGPDTVRVLGSKFPRPLTSIGDCGHRTDSHQYAARKRCSGRRRRICPLFIHRPAEATPVPAALFPLVRSAAASQVQFLKFRVMSRRPDKLRCKLSHAMSSGFYPIFVSFLRNAATPLFELIRT